MIDFRSVENLTLCDALEIALAKVRTEISSETADTMRRERLKTLSEMLDLNIDEEGCSHVDRGITSRDW